MRFLFSALLLSVSLVASPQSPAKTPRLRTFTNREAYKVYAALLPGNWSFGKPPAKYLVMQQETDTGFDRGCSPNLHGSWADVLNDYRHENRTPRLLSSRIPIEIPYSLAPPVEMTDIFSVPVTSPLEAWNRFYSRYPGSDGFIAFSAVGFNRDKTKALVYVARRWGSTCGEGGYEFLVKRDGKWVKADINAPDCGWIS